MYVQKYGQYSQFSPAGHFADFRQNFRIFKKFSGKLSYVGFWQQLPNLTNLIGLLSLIQPSPLKSSSLGGESEEDRNSTRESLSSILAVISLQSSGISARHLQSLHHCLWGYLHRYSESHHHHQYFQSKSLLERDRVLGSCVLGGCMFARGKGEEHWDQVLKFPKQVKYLKEVLNIYFFKGKCWNYRIIWKKWGVSFLMLH